MKLLVYFLILANAIFLFVNWDTISGVAAGKTTSQTLAGETLVLRGEDQIPVSPNYQPPPEVPSGGPATGLISGLIGIFAEIFATIGNLFSDAPQDLPSAEDEAAKRRADLGPPSPTGPQPLSRCYILFGYTSAEAALVDVDILNTYGLRSKMRGTADEEEEEVVVEAKRYRIVAKVRTSLDAAKQLSDVLSGSAIPNRIQEDNSLGYLLVTRFYDSESQAKRVLNKVRGLGFSATMQSFTASGSPQTSASASASGETASKPRLYELVIEGNQVFVWESSRNNLLTVINQDAKVRVVPRC